MATTQQTVTTRSIDWDDLVRRISGPLPAKTLVYEFSGDKKKYVPREHNPFKDEEE